MRIKFVVSELRAINRNSGLKRSRNGFHSFMVSLQGRVDNETGEIDLDDEDFAKIRLYSRTGYKKRLLAVFGRTLSRDFDANQAGWH